LPEQTLPLFLDDCPYFLERFFIVPLLSQAHPFVEMVGSEPFPIFFVEFTLSFTLLDPQQYFSHAHSHWVLNITPPNCSFQISLIPNLSLVPMDD
jgi:hypothetical protein